MQSKHNTNGTISARVAGKIGTPVKLNQSDLGKRSSMDEQDQVTVVLPFKEFGDIIQ
jgi:hypothetical protein